MSMFLDKKGKTLTLREANERGLVTFPITIKRTVILDAEELEEYFRRQYDERSDYFPVGTDHYDLGDLTGL